MSQRALVLSVIGIAVVVGVGGVFYAFGTPTQATPQQVPSGSPVAGSELNQTGETSDEVLPADGSGSDAPVAGEVPAPDPSVPLAIEIPGCVCHSDDPKVVEEHAEYRMNQCAGCHAGQVPTGQ